MYGIADIEIFGVDHTSATDANSHLDLTISSDGPRGGGTDDAELKIPGCCERIAIKVLSLT